MAVKGKKDKIVRKGSKMKESLKAKLAAKRVKISGAAVAGLALLCVCGCQSTPSRAQSMTIKDSVFYVMVPNGFSPTNAVSAEGLAAGVVGDLFSQNQVVENSGSESLVPTQTVSTPTQLSYGVGGGSSWTDFWSGLASVFKGSSAVSAAAAAKAPSAECEDCQE